MLPVLFTIGPFNVYAFGFFLAISFIFATFIVFKYGKEELKEEEYLDTFLYTSFAALISSRITYIIFNFEDFGFNLLRYIVVRETPGLSLLAGSFGGFIFLWWYSHRKKYPFLPLLDLFSVAGSLALFFAKIGEQLGGGSFGRETNFILGVKKIGLPGRYHPVELYEAIFYFFLTIILLWVYGRVRVKKLPTGFSFFIMGELASLSLFLLEFLKIREVYLWGLGIKQIIAVVLIAIFAKPLISYFIKAKLGYRARSEL